MAWVLGKVSDEELEDIESRDWDPEILALPKVARFFGTNVRSLQAEEDDIPDKWALVWVNWDVRDILDRIDE